MVPKLLVECLGSRSRMSLCGFRNAPRIALRCPFGATLPKAKHLGSIPGPPRTDPRQTPVALESAWGALGKH